MNYNWGREHTDYFYLYWPNNKIIYTISNLNMTELGRETKHKTGTEIQYYVSGDLVDFLILELVMSFINYLSWYSGLNLRIYWVKYSRGDQLLYSLSFYIVFFYQLVSASVSKLVVKQKHKIAFIKTSQNKSACKLPSSPELFISLWKDSGELKSLLSGVCWYQNELCLNKTACFPSKKFWSGSYSSQIDVKKRGNHLAFNYCFPWHLHTVLLL